jgi:hypothetical protein
MTSIDVTDWAPAKVEGFLTAIKSDQPGIEISVTLRSDGQQQMSMALSDERASDYVASQCEVCQSVTVSKVLPLGGIKGRKALQAPSALGTAGETDDQPKPTHDHTNHRNGTEFH